MSKTYSAGIVTAYGAAKRAGYQGTYEDFCRQQAGYAGNAAAVEASKTAAQTAANTATTKAGEATTAATAAQTAKTQTEQAASQALTDIAAARSGTISAVQTEGATQTANARSQAQAAATSANTASTKASEASAFATSAGQSATNAAASATNAASSASAAQAVLESIPEDYSDLSEDVGQLKADLGEEYEQLNNLTALVVDSVKITNRFIRGKRYLDTGFSNAANYAVSSRYTAGTYKIKAFTPSFRVVKYISDTEGEYLTNWVSGDTSITTDSDFYISFSNVTSDTVLDNINSNFAVTQILRTDGKDLTTRVEALENATDDNAIAVEYIGNGAVYISTEDNNGYIGATGAVNPPVNGEVYTQLITTDDILTIKVNIGESGTTQWIAVCEYNSEGMFQNRTVLVNGSTEKTVTISYTPSDNVSYIRITARLYTEGNLSVWKDSEIQKKINNISEQIVPIFSSVEATVKSIAHRGDDIYAPQSTTPAYILARKRGYTIAENDVWFSEDGFYVMEHDTSLKRLGNMVDINGYLMYTDGTDYYWVHPTTNAVYTYDHTNEEYVSSAVSLSGLTRCAGANYGVNSTYDVIGLNLNILKRIDFGAYKGEKFKGTQILTFEEWVLLCKQLGMEIYIDRKFNYTNEQIADLANIVKKYGMGDKASWLGMDGAKIIALRNIIPNSRCCLLQHPSDELIEAYTPYNVGRGFFFNGDGRTMTEEAIQKGLNAGFEVEVWYVDYGAATEEQIFDTIRTAVSYGVTGMSLDHYRVGEAFDYLLEVY